jgi:hypothetical protein
MDVWNVGVITNPLIVIITNLFASCDVRTSIVLLPKVKLAKICSSDTSSELTSAASNLRNVDMQARPHHLFWAQVRLTDRMHSSSIL